MALANTETHKMQAKPKQNAHNSKSKPNQHRFKKFSHLCG